MSQQQELPTYQQTSSSLERRVTELQDENKSLRLTLALRTDCEHELERVRNETHPGVEELEKKLASAENEIRVMESTNKELMATLATTRDQLGKMLRERNQLVKDVDELHEEIEKMESLYNKPADYASNSYTDNMKLMLDELNDQCRKWETEKAKLTEHFKEAETQLRRENVKLEAQKEDILNHTKNSEKMWNERLENITADFERLKSSSKPSGIRADQKMFQENEMKIQELNRKLKDALEAIEEIEDANSALRVDLERRGVEKCKMEEELNFHKGFLIAEQQSFLLDCANFENQIANLNKEMTELEELRDAYKQQIGEITEKHAQQTMTFSNEKAKFCHAMERVEEKWNAECVKLRDEIGGLQKMLFQSTKETMDKREIFDEESRECRRKIDELEGLLATQQAAAQRQITRLLAEIDDLNVQLSDTKSVQANAVKEWDVECAELEEEIYELIGKRKTEGKKLRTMQRKNTWLTASIRRLSEQRREELAAKKDEILKLNSLCELQRMEKVEWLSDLKKDVNAWKNETSVRIELKQKITDLEEQNEGLEEKVENVLAQYRSECELYQNSVSSLQMDRDRLRKDVDLYKGKAEILFTKFGDLVKTNDELEKKAHQKMLEADNLRKTVEFSNMEMTNVKALMAMEREQILEERHSTVRDLEEKLKNLTMVSAFFFAF